MKMPSTNINDFISKLSSLDSPRINALLRKARIKTEVLQLGGEKISVVLKEGSPNFPKRILGKGRGEGKDTIVISAIVDAYGDNVNDCKERLSAAID